ncbi:MAG: prolyl oligopeptidase family serine peptidase, partial [Mycobacterium sp.]|uniref:alpha/beta hydrolase family protein n=1 Tax=Mycobacterium sp. TaxID=1785 RepID=UPI001EB1298A
AAEPPPTVIILGGFDGWREEYQPGAHALLARGMACLLLDGPGQGETRLFGGLYMDPASPTAAYSVALDVLLDDPRVSNVVGIWGNSLGGYLAATAISAEPRFAACCINGGTVRPAELPERHPRFITKVQAMYGLSDPVQALRALENATIDAAGLTRIHCPLLVLHGTPDRVFLVENAHALYTGAASRDKTWKEWPDGDHCLYNHTAEKHALVGDWFADRLADFMNSSAQQ